jgi:hypothetical protein
VGEREGVGERGREWGKEGEMTQTLYAHMNKIKKEKSGDLHLAWSFLKE